MGKSTIPLAKSKFTPEKLDFPVAVMEKFDGVPLRIDVIPDAEGNVKEYAVRTRQDEQNFSALMQVENLLAHMIDEMQFNNIPITDPYTIIAETVHETFTNFKDVSGIVRRQEQQRGLILKVFDFVIHGPQTSNEPWAVRMGRIKEFLPNSCVVDMQVILSAPELALWLQDNPPKGIEGYIIRDLSDTFQPNSRNNSYQKYVLDPVSDLLVVGFEEAVCGKTGEGKGMVGRVIVEYKGERTGCGPGKLTHDERVELWEQGGSFVPEYAAIKHKRDPSYDKMRQPTFQHWKPECSEPSLAE